jgi:hypothetical protein
MKTLQFEELKPYLNAYPMDDETNGRRYRCTPILYHSIVIRHNGHSIDVGYIDEHVDADGEWSLIICDDLGDTFITHLDSFDVEIFKSVKII